MFDAAQMALSSLRSDHATRASDQGYLPIGLGTYLSLLDWTGCHTRAASRATIQSHFAPIL
jgi:hypothetical protein